MFQSQVRVWIVLLALGFCAIVSRETQAQVEVRVNPLSGTVNDVFDLTVTVDTSAVRDSSRPVFDSDANFTIEFQQRGSVVQIINGSVQQSVTYSFAATPTPQLKPGEYTLPEGRITIDGQSMKIHPEKITIIATSDDDPAPANGVQFEQRADNTTPFVGEQIIYTAELVATARISNPQFSPLEATGVWKESFGKNTTRVRSIGNAGIRVVDEKQALYPSISGEIRIPARFAELQVEVPSSARKKVRDPWFSGGGLFDQFDDIFDLGPFYNVKNIRLHSKDLVLAVKPLPPPPRPGWKNIPVGRLSVASAISSGNVKQGESLTMTVELYGDANLRSFELPKPANTTTAFKIYYDQPKIEIIPQQDRIFQKKSFNIALIPQESGSVKLPVFEFIWFDPREAKYVVELTPERLIEVEPVPNFVPSPQVSLPVPILDDGKGETSLTSTSSEIWPQRLSQTVLRPQSSFPVGAFVALLMFPPTLYLLMTMRALLAAGVRGPMAQRRRALKRAISSILSNSDPNNALREIDRAVRHFIEQSTEIPATGLTAREITERLKAVVRDQNITNDAERLLQKTESFRYAGRATGQEGISVELATLKGQAIKLVKALYREFKRS